MRFSVDLAKHHVGVALQCSSKTGSNTRHSRHHGPRKSTSTNWRRPRRWKRFPLLVQSLPPYTPLDPFGGIGKALAVSAVL